MGASGYEGHVVVCGWNSTARDLIAELRSDAYKVKIVVIAPLDKNPAGDGRVLREGRPDRARPTSSGPALEKASAALIFPVDDSNDADMRSILTVIAIESVAPDVRTVAEVNNPRHADHFRRARVDELLVSSQVGARLLARSALYPGLTELVADIVSGGDGSELYRVEIPDDYLGLSVDEVSARLRSEHRATLLSISRGGKAFVNPPADFGIVRGDDAVVVAESLGTLAPLVLKHEENGTGVVPAVAGQRPPRSTSLRPSARPSPRVSRLRSGPRRSRLALQRRVRVGPRARARAHRRPPRRHRRRPRDPRPRSAARARRLARARPPRSHPRPSTSHSRDRPLRRRGPRSGSPPRRRRRVRWRRSSRSCRRRRPSPSRSCRSRRARRRRSRSSRRRRPRPATARTASARRSTASIELARGPATRVTVAGRSGGGAARRLSPPPSGPEGRPSRRRRASRSSGRRTARCRSRHSRDPSSA